MPETIEKSLLELDFASLTRRTFTPSPAAWEDQVLYFLLLDRFSDGNEKGGYRDEADGPVHGGSTPPARPRESGRGGSAPATAGRAARSRDSGANSAISGGWASPPSGSAPSSARLRSSQAITA